MGRPKFLTSIPLPKGTREAFTVISDLAFEALRNIVQDPDHPRHEQACEYALNQKWGTARQHVEISDPSGSFGGKHELTVNFANTPNTVQVTRVPAKGDLPWEDKPAAPEPEPKTVSAVVNATPTAVAVAVSAPMPFLPWEREVDEDDE